jgi:hypothetical protein
VTCQSVRGDRDAVVHARRVALPAAPHPGAALPPSCFGAGCLPVARCYAAMRRARLRRRARGHVPVELPLPVSVAARVAARRPVLAYAG